MSNPNGNRPKPNHLKLITGSKYHNRKEPKFPSHELPMPPPELDLDARTEWIRTAPELQRAGVLTKIDRTMLAQYCQAYSRWVRAERVMAQMAKSSPDTYGLIYQKASGDWAKNPMVAILERAQQDVVRYCGELGMTPTSRSKIRVDQTPEEDADPAAEYFR